jgi:alpha-glucosidase
MRDANIPLETQWTDIDLFHALRDFTTDPITFPLEEVIELITELVISFLCN